MFWRRMRQKLADEHGWGQVGNGKTKAMYNIIFHHARLR